MAPKTSPASTIRIITPDTVRRMAVTAQRLSAPLPAAAGPEQLLETMRTIRAIQLDPISVVARSHQLVLFSRVGPYDAADLDILLWKDRSLFEYWAHAASIVLTEDYQIHRMLMRSYPKGDRPYRVRARHWMEANRALRDAILRRLRAEGPLPSRAIEDASQQGWRSTGWTNERNVSRMLDMLWTQGRIMVAGRDGLQKLWDLAERCLPEWTPRASLPEPTIVRRAIEHSIRALGVGTKKHIREHFTIGRYPGLDEALVRLQREGRIQPLRVADDEGAWPGPWYVHQDLVSLLDVVASGGFEPRTTLLSPFDNLIISRSRMELLFDFFFRMEIYVPRDKRRYGYYAMPILHGDRLIGVVDPAMDRKSGRLTINTVHASPGAPLNRSTGLAVRGTIEDLARFLRASDVDVVGSVPRGWGAVRS